MKKYIKASFDSISDIFDASKHISDSDWYQWLDNELYDYFDSYDIDWDWDNLSDEDLQFLKENPDWEKYIKEEIIDM